MRSYFTISDVEGKRPKQREESWYCRSPNSRRGAMTHEKCVKSRFQKIEVGGKIGRLLTQPIRPAPPGL